MLTYKLPLWICNETVAIGKEYSLRRHCTTKHSQKFGSWTRLKNERKEKLKKNLVGQQNIFVKSNEEAEDIVRASYIVSKKEAGYSKPFSEGEFMEECLIEQMKEKNVYQEEQSKNK